MRQWIFKLILCVIMSANMSSAVPTIPMVISGNVSINGEPAPVGTEVKALMNGEVSGSYVVSKKGIYGLIVENRPGIRTVDIYVNELKSMTPDWSSEPHVLNLAVTARSSQPIEKTGLSHGTTITNTYTPTATATVKAEVLPKAEKTAFSPESQEQNRSQGQENARSPGFNLLNVFIAILLIFNIIKRRRSHE